MLSLLLLLIFCLYHFMLSKKTHKFLSLLEPPKVKERYSMSDRTHWVLNLQPLKIIG